MLLSESQPSKAAVGPGRQRFCELAESQRTRKGLEGKVKRDHQEELKGPWIFTKRLSPQGMEGALGLTF